MKKDIHDNMDALCDAAATVEKQAETVRSALQNVREENPDGLRARVIRPCELHSPGPWHQGSAGIGTAIYDSQGQPVCRLDEGSCNLKGNIAAIALVPEMIATLRAAHTELYGDPFGTLAAEQIYKKLAAAAKADAAIEPPAPADKATEPTDEPTDPPAAAEASEPQIPAVEPSAAAEEPVDPMEHRDDDLTVPCPHQHPDTGACRLGPYKPDGQCPPHTFRNRAELAAGWRRRGHSSIDCMVSKADAAIQRAHYKSSDAREDMPNVFQDNGMPNMRGRFRLDEMQRFFALKSLDEIYQCIYRTAVRNGDTVEAVIVVPNAWWLIALWRTVMPASLDGVINIYYIFKPWMRFSTMFVSIAETRAEISKKGASVALVNREKRLRSELSKMRKKAKID